MTAGPTTDEQMVWSLARRCRAGDVVVVGAATPMAAAAVLLARRLLVPDLTIILGQAVDPPIHDISLHLREPEALDGLATTVMGQLEVLDELQRGLITLQFVSPAQVDAEGCLNTSRVPSRQGTRRLTGGLATADVAVLVGRLVAYRAQHSRRFLTKQVHFVTGAGRFTIEGAQCQLPGQGVRTVITDRAVIDLLGEAPSRLASVHRGASVQEVIRDCGFPLEVEEPVLPTEPPPQEALELLRRVIDPHGARRLEMPSSRRSGHRVVSGPR